MVIKQCINLLMLVMLFTSCDNFNDPCSKTGVVRDFLGQDGCSVLIEEPNGDLYAPTNLNEFGLFFFDGQRVNFSFRLDPSTSPCQLGVPVLLLCVESID